MRLIEWNSKDEFNVTDDLSEDSIPPYAILSHTWGSDHDELTYADLRQNEGHHKAGFSKLQFCKEQAERDGYKHVWIDTCCINKDSHSELSEAIISMFNWYKNAQKCYVYLTDVSMDGPDTPDALEARIRASRWFTRGWTLQELLAPKNVEFFSREGKPLGDKQTLAQQIHEITGIPFSALQGAPLSKFSVSERMQWAARRQTKKKEDKAYCLLGLFGVFLPLMYGEGDNAFCRLEHEINARTVKDSGLSNAQDLELHGTADSTSLGLALNSAPTIDANWFIGRAAEIANIASILLPGNASIEQRRVVLGGMGGIGKTQMAIAYARQHQNHYPSVIWLNASSELTLFASFRSVAQAFDSIEISSLSDEQILARVHYWLSRPTNPRWLLIFDNYDEPDQFNINKFCPNIGHGSVMVTTRLPDLVDGQVVRVRPLQAIEDGLEILRTRSRREHIKTDKGARCLAERLEGLPLALATAGAYLCKTSLTFQQYLDLYEQRWKIDRRPIRLQEYQDRTLYTTWSLSHSRLLTDDPDAAQMLKLLAFFDNQGICYDLLQAGESGELAWTNGILDDHAEFESVMRVLVEYCLVDVQHGTQSYSVHGCVHDWMLGGLNEVIDPRYYNYAFSCLSKWIGGQNPDRNKLSKYARFIPHAVRLTHHRFEQSFVLHIQHLPVRLSEGNWLASFLVYNIQFAAAERISKWLLAGYNDVYGPDHPVTFETMQSLGSILMQQNKLSAAEDVYKRTIAKLIEMYGPHDIAVLEVTTQLGRVYYEQERFDKAKETYGWVLTECEAQEDPQNIGLFDIQNYIGYWYLDQGKLDTAKQLFQQALAGYEAINETETITALQTLGNLGLVFMKQGNPEIAGDMYKRALAGKEKWLGPKHYITLQTVYDLAVAYYEQKKLDEARDLFQRALDGFECFPHNDFGMAEKTRNWLRHLDEKQ